MEDIVQIIIYIAFGLLYTLSRYLRNKRKDKQRDPGKKKPAPTQQPVTEEPSRQSTEPPRQTTPRNRPPKRSASTKPLNPNQPSRPKKGFSTTLEEMLREFAEESESRQRGQEEAEPHQPSPRYGKEEAETRFDVPADQLDEDDEKANDYEPYKKPAESDTEARSLEENPDYVNIGAENRGRAGAYRMKRKKSYARRVAQDLKKPSGLKKAIVLKEILDRKEF